MSEDAGANTLNSKLPAGTVTFLFTDIEGSTQLLDQLRDQYAILLADQRRILRAAFTHWQGQEVDTQGDAFFVAFPRATAAVSAAVEIQSALAAHQWPEGVEVRVRMGLHTGEPWMVEEGYVGMDVHRAARIGYVGYGGQVLLSETTTALVVNELPEGISLKDLGWHRLKDMRRPEHIHQLLIATMPSEFPPLKSLEVIAPTPIAPEVSPGLEARKVGTSPYRGLAAFRETDAALFFGREAFTEQLALAVQERGLVAVIVGPSGSGKSSTVFAGLLPRLRDDDEWLIVETRPGNRPFYALADALLASLEDDLSEADRLIENQKLAQAMREGELPLFQIVNRALKRHPGARRMLLVIDQFEELFTLRPDPEAQRLYLDELLAATESGASYHRSPLVLLLTLRADFMGQALTHRPFADALQDGSLILGPMNRQELQAAVEKPAEQQGAAFESGLVQRILDDVGQEPGNLPLLEFALTLLWERMDGGWMTHSAYEEIGRVDGALARYAEEVYSELGSEEKEKARRLFVQLVQPGEGTEDTRRVARRTEMADEGWSLIQYLADRRLVVTGRDESGGKTVEVVHEALIRGWDRLRLWMKEDRSFRTWQEGLRLALRGWEASGQDEGALLRGAPLAMALEWTVENQDQMSPAELAYIKASQQESERQAAEEEVRRQRELETAQQLAEVAQARAEDQTQAARRLRRRAVYLAGALVVAILLAIAAVIFSRQADLHANAAEKNARLAATQGAAAVAESNQRATAQVQAESEADLRATAEAEAVKERILAEEQARLATSRELAAAAINNLEIDTELSVLLALEANKTAKTAESEYALHKALKEYKPVRTLGEAEGLSPVTVAFGPNGQYLILGGYFGAITVWDTFADKAHISWQGHADYINEIAFSPDGALFITASDDQTLKLWDFKAILNIGAENLQELPEVEPVKTITSDDYNLSVAYSPDGTRVVAGLYDSEQVEIWDVATGEKVLSLRSEIGPTWPIRFSSDGKWLLGASGEGPGGVWDAETGQQLDSFAPNDTVSAIAISPNGSYVATDSVDGPVKIWDSETDELLSTLIGHPGATFAMGFTADNLRLVTGGRDGTVKVWEVPSGDLLFTLAAEAGAIQDIDISPECTAPPDSPFEWCGSRLAVSYLNRTSRIWDIAPGVSTEYALLPGFTGVFGPGENEFTTIMPQHSPNENRIQIWQFQPPSSEGPASHEVEGRATAVEKRHYNAPYWHPLAETGSFEQILSQDQSLLADIGYEGEIVVYDHHNGEVLHTFTADTHDAISTQGWHPDNRRFATAGADGSVSLWDIQTGEALYTLTDHEGPVSGVGFSADGDRLATNSEDGTLRIWDVNSGEPILVLPKETGLSASSVHFSPDGSYLAIPLQEGLGVWNLASGEERLFTGHTGLVLYTAIDPSGERVATCSLDNTVKIWDLETGTELLKLEGGPGDLRFSSDGKLLGVDQVFDETVHIFVLDLDILIELAQARVSRMLTDNECQQYLHLEACPELP